MRTGLHVPIIALILSCETVPASSPVSQDVCPPADSPAAVLTEEDIRDGWSSIFDGRSFAGWHRYGGDPVGPAWKVENGAMTLIPGEVVDDKTAGGGDIVTDGIYEDFELSLEWRIAEGGNSGIFYLVDSAEVYFDAATSGLEMQVLDSERHGDGQYPKHRAGDLYDLIEADERAECEVGAWNHVRIVKKGPHVEHWMNGKILLSFDLWTVEWNAMVAASKFVEWEGFGASRRGRIGLQDHLDQVWYRGLRIRLL